MLASMLKIILSGFMFQEKRNSHVKVVQRTELAISHINNILKLSGT